MNWKLRLQNKITLTSLIAAALLIAQLICQKAGIAFDIEWVNVLISAVLEILVLLGVVTDPTVPGLGDSAVSLDKTSINETAQEVLERNSEVKYVGHVGE